MKEPIRGFIELGFLRCLPADEPLPKELLPSPATVAVSSIRQVRPSPVMVTYHVPELAEWAEPIPELCSRWHQTAVLVLEYGGDVYHWHVAEPYEVVQARMRGAQ